MVTEKTVPAARVTLTAVLVAAQIFTSILTWTSIADAATGDLEVHVDRQTIRDGETVTLVLRHRGQDGARNAPDLSPLRESFDVLGTGQSQHTSIVNGTIDRSIEWSVSLAPRTTGDLTVPAIRWGDASSTPLTIRVLDGAAQDAAAGPPDLFIEAGVDSTTPYVQGQVTYTVRVYDAIGVHDAALTQPAGDNVRVEALGEPRSFEMEVKGRLYQVYEQTFTLFPESSGSVVISPVTLRARVMDRGRRRAPLGGSVFEDFFDNNLLGRRFPQATSLFDDFLNPGRQIQVRSEAITLSVQARPDGAEDGWFLPATDVTLSETWEPERPTFRVGEPVTRTVMLQALGAAAEQLPEVEIPAAEGVRQYPERSLERTIPTESGTLSIRRQSVAIVPTTAGTTTLPPVEIEWWDVERKEKRTAALPARNIEVLTGVGSADQPAAPQAGAAGETEAQTALVDGEAATRIAPVDGASAEPMSPRQATSLGWIRSTLLQTIVGLCLIAAATGTGLWIVRRRRGAAAPRGSHEAGSIETAPALSRPRHIVPRVRAACVANDPRGARTALMDWARSVWPDGPPATLTGVARRLRHEGFTDALRDLDRCLYGKHEPRWAGQALWTAFEAARSSASTPAATPPVLPSLYPEGHAA